MKIVNSPAFEASSVVFVVADHDLLGSIHGGVAFWAFSRLHRFERHFKADIAD